MGAPDRPPDPDALAAIAALLAAARHPVLVLGSDVWMDGADEAARAFAEELRLPVVANGQGRGVLPAGHGLLATRARRTAFAEADLVIVAGTPLDFRLGYGSFGGGAAKVVHLADAPSALARHTGTAGRRGGRPGAHLRRPGGGLRHHAASPPPRTRPGRPRSATPPAPRSPPTPDRWPRAPTRSTRCGSTGSWPGSWTTTRW